MYTHTYMRILNHSTIKSVKVKLSNILKGLLDEQRCALVSLPMQVSGESKNQSFGFVLRVNPSRANTDAETCSTSLITFLIHSFRFTRKTAIRWRWRCALINNEAVEYHTRLSYRTESKRIKDKCSRFVAIFLDFFLASGSREASKACNGISLYIALSRMLHLSSSDSLQQTS